MSERTLRVAMIGCGAAAEFIHLPALQRRVDCQLHTLVDAKEARARELGERFPAMHFSSDYRSLSDEVDAAIIALPHHLHADAAVQLLSRGIHVLVEKPMAATPVECRRMIQAAEQSGAVLSVGMVRRFYQTSRLVKRLVESSVLGRIHSVDWREGYVFGWPVASDFMFRKSAGGGLMGDIGSHVLDLLLWWFGDFEDVQCLDDALGGVEAECELRLTRPQLGQSSKQSRDEAGDDGLQVIVELSRTRNLRNTCIVRGELGTLEFGVDVNSQVRLTFQDQHCGIQGRAFFKEEAPVASIHDAFQHQLRDFVESIVHQRPPLVSGCEGARVVALLEKCAAVRQPLRLPWLSPAAPQQIAMQELEKAGAAS